MKRILLIIVLLISTSQLFASHLMGGQITAKKIDSFKYEMLLTIYRDTDGIPIDTYITINYNYDSLGTWVNLTSHGVFVDSGAYFLNGTEVYHYIDTIVFPSAGQYKIAYSNCCRNAAIINMTTPAGESLFLQTILTVDANGGNSSPEFLNPPVTLAQKNWPWFYNPLPYDADGDSIAWQLVTPLSMSGVPVVGYTIPRANALMPFTLDTLTGAITWMPDTIGHFVASFLVSEFKNGIKIGEIRRDMQIIVQDDPSNTFRMAINATGVVTGSNGRLYVDALANQPLTVSIAATDVDNDFLNISAEGETFKQNNASAFISTNGAGAASAIFSWTPNMSQVRDRPYIDAFRGSEHHVDYDLVHDVTVLFRVKNANGMVSLANNENKFENIYPNPSSNNQLVIPFQLSADASVKIEVVNVLGQHVKTLFNKNLPSGKNVVLADNLQINQGIYFVQTYVNGVLANTQRLIRN